jgi:pimeloyl-ACP methyl ester carboxylesterase
MRMSATSRTQAVDLPSDLPEVEGVEHRFVDAGGLRVHVAEAGQGDPVLLLHGWPQHWFMWRGVIERLAPQFRLIAPDLRGFGWTEAPGEGYHPDTFAEDQIALLDALEIETAKVIGHDWGGYTSLLMGVRHPDRIERVLACDTPHPWARVRPSLLFETWRSWYAVAMAAPLIGPRLAASRVPDFILSHGHAGSPFTSEELKPFLRRLRDPERADATTQLYRSYLGLFARGLRGGLDVGRLEVPTLLLFGERDLYVSTKLIEGYERYAPEMKVELVPDSGHFIVDEKPELVARRALAFLS